jgi:hypothetical protein
MIKPSRFTSLQEVAEKKNPFICKNNKLEKKTQILSRWNELNLIKEKNNAFQNSRSNNFKKSNEKFDSYEQNNNFNLPRHRSAFKRNIRPKTPPPKEFNLEKDDFPPLG